MKIGDTSKMRGAHPAFRRHGACIPAPGHRAFTIVELLIVVVLMAIAATMVMPLFADSGATRLRAATRLLVADLAFAQIESITHADDTCVMSFDQANGAYTIAKSSAPTTPMTDPITNQPYVTQFGSGRASETAGVSIQAYSLGGDNKIVFGQYGEIDQTTAATITLQSGVLTMTVQIDPTSGEATIQ